MVHWRFHVVVCLPCSTATGGFQMDFDRDTTSTIVIDDNNFDNNFLTA
jgi:hypothetical protein